MLLHKILRSKYISLFSLLIVTLVHCNLMHSLLFRLKKICVLMIMSLTHVMLHYLLLSSSLYDCTILFPSEGLFRLVVTALLLYRLNFIFVCTKDQLNTNLNDYSYTPSLYRSYLSIGTEYLHSVTCIIKPT